MAVRGKYSDLEKESLEDFEKEADTRQGWYKAPPDMPPSMRGNPIITAATLKEYVSRLDPWNPFWNLEEYAAATRWGGLIAHPFYLELLKPRESMLRSRKGLFLTFYLMGHDYEYFQPIRPGDTIRTWAFRPTLEDSTDLSGKGPRKFHCNRSDGFGAGDCTLRGAYTKSACADCLPTHVGGFRCCWCGF